MSTKPARNHRGFWGWVFQTFTIYDHCDPTSDPDADEDAYAGDDHDGADEDKPKGDTL